MKNKTNKQIEKCIEESCFIGIIGYIAGVIFLFLSILNITRIEYSIIIFILFIGLTVEIEILKNRLEIRKLKVKNEYNARIIKNQMR
jgi:uncharacterized membrane protein